MKARVSLAAGAPDTPVANPRRRFLGALAAALGVGALAGRPRAARAAANSSQPYIGEVMLWAGNFAPVGWRFCDGSLLPIQVFDTLFSLIGNYYGGDGQTTFAVPDLRGRVPIHVGQGPGLSNRSLGEVSGAERHTLIATQLPAHTHAAACMAAAGTSDSPGALLPARNGAGNLAWGTGAAASLAAAHIDPAGSSLSHENRMPILTLNFCIAYDGIYPSHP